MSQAEQTSDLSLQSGYTNGAGLRMALLHCDKWEYGGGSAKRDGYYWRCVWHCAHPTVSPPSPWGL